MGSRHPRQGHSSPTIRLGKATAGAFQGSDEVKSLLDGSTGTSPVPPSPPSSTPTLSGGWRSPVRARCERLRGRHPSAL